ncbi:hypothetical protein SpCBS45565_g05733 [Spizellomyces sp. 'palustris']|nr:hypothetical protein SpCBS45565_g05733 [Spizellomyces sp. 'palustris']
MAVLRNCCCCINLRTGFIIIATILLLTDLISPNAFLPESSTLSAALNPPLSNPLRLFDLIMVGLGLYGAIKNRIAYVKVFAIYMWISVALSLFVFIVSAVALTANIPQSEEFCRKHNNGNNMDCDLLVKIALAAYTIVGGLFFAVSIYFGLCIWSYYQDLRDHPEKYGATVVAFVYLPVRGDEEHIRDEPSFLTPKPVIEEELPSYTDASLTGTSSSVHQAVAPKEDKPTK